MELGKQYDKDDAFKKSAREHQSKFRLNNLKADYNEYGNRLTDKSAKEGLNYYLSLNVIQVLRNRFPNYSRPRDADMLRSEHIPFNFFAPLKAEYDLAKKVLNKLIDNKIKTIESIEIEYAPDPKSEFLNDNTSFDTFIKFKNQNDDLCGIGIEVKYTEHEYKLKTKSKEDIDINDPESKYSLITKKSGIYIDNAIEKLRADEFRQIWRNHLLGESMKERGDIKEFYSLLLFPKGNKHFRKVIPKYSCLLKEHAQLFFIDVTFETFLQVILEQTYNMSNEYKNWVNYLNQRYIF